MKHHLMKEEDMNSRCIYCNSIIDIKEWKSEFERFFHYKAVRCGRCKKENRLRVYFSGSGHDEWAEGIESKL
jgi:hypothetical protein